jgi:hypothetical protein
MYEDVVASKISAKTTNPTTWYEIDPHDVTCFIYFYIYGYDMYEDAVASKISAKTTNPTAWYEIDPHDVTCFILFLYLWLWYVWGRGGEQDLCQDP